MRYWQCAQHMGRSLSAAAFSLGLGLVAIGCGAEDPVVIDSEAVAMPTPEVLVQDSSYMGRLFNERSSGRPFIGIDLADQRQYQFVIHRLLRAGKTPANSPRLFESLSKGRAAHRARLAAKTLAVGVKGAGEVTTASAAGGGGTRCGHFMVVTGNTAAGQYNVDGHALMSCFNGMDNITLDQAIFRANEDETNLELLAVGFKEDFAGIEVRTPVLHASTPAGQGKVVLSDSTGVAVDETTGEVEFTFTRYKTEAETAATIRAAGSDASCSFDHPRDSTGDGNVRLCYQRSFFAGYGDCDYVAVNALNQPGVPPFTHIAMVEVVAGLYIPSLTERWPIPGAPVNSVPNLFLPMMGTFNAGTKSSNGQKCQIKQLQPSDTWAAATLRTTGGWCAGAGTFVPGDEGQLFQNLRTNFTALGGIPGNLNEIPFGKNISSIFDEPNLLSDFGPDCLQNLQDACLVISISAKTNCSDPNNPSDRTRTATCEVCFDVRNSCFAAGTPIRRANGATVPVEEIQVGDQIIANETGAVITVSALTRGVEPEPMVRLKDSLGHELMLTSKHPVITTKGAMPADEITTTSQVQTENGIASIVEVERVRYGGLVYNLSVGTPEELAILSGSNRTLFAGGIRVGDNEMQFDMERQSKRASIERAPSPAWEIDRKNAAARRYSQPEVAPNNRQPADRSGEPPGPKASCR